MKKYPFKFLDSYNQDDTDMFFGRNEETDALYSMVFQNSILLIYGASGTGKTSLIQCGLAGKFKPYDWLPLIIRRGNNINASLEKQLADAGGNDVDDEDITTKDPSKKITGLLRLIKGVYLNNFKPIYLIFDQFEELYVLGTKAEQQQFIEAVKEILRAEQPVKMIFSIREEYLGYLNEFEKEVPQLLHKKLRIEAMTLDKVSDVIKGINNYKLSNVRIKTDEIDTITQGIFDKIKGKKKTLTIELPYLQVFLDKLYVETTHDESRQADALITLDVLNRIGDIGDVLRNFLEEQVKAISTRLSAKYKNVTTEVIWKILSPFSTLEGTKEPISKKELAERLPDLDKKLIDESVESFVNSRIVNCSEDENLYELAHDSLALRIAEKRSDEEIAILEVQRLIKSQLSVKDEAREYFTERQLLFIEPYLEKFKVSDEERDWINRSRSYKEEEQKNQQEQLLKLQEAKATKKRLRIVLGLLSIAIITTAAAAFFGIIANKAKKEAVAQATNATLQSDTAIIERQKADSSNKIIQMAIDSIQKVIFGLPEEDSIFKRSFEQIQNNILHQYVIESKPVKKEDTLTVGSVYQGGIVFFLYQTNDHGLIVAQSDLNDCKKTGWENANALCKQFSPADGFDNWRLPTINELKLIYNERNKISGLHQNDLYWSSSIAGNGYASLINFGNGATNYRYNTTQGHLFYARAVREF